jgi:hypothetical protein
MTDEHVRSAECSQALRRLDDQEKAAYFTEVLRSLDALMERERPGTALHQLSAEAGAAVASLLGYFIGGIDAPPEADQPG